MKRISLVLALSFFAIAICWSKWTDFPNIMELPQVAELIPLEPISKTDATPLLTQQQFKELKKKYKTKNITYELWPNGNYYYVLHKGNQSALLTEDFDPVHFRDESNRELFYVYKLSPTIYNGKGYIFASEDDIARPGLFTMNGKTLLPIRYYNEYIGFIMNGEETFIGMSFKDGLKNFSIGAGTENSDSHGLWINGDIDSFKFYPATKEGYVDTGHDMQYWAPAHDDYIALISTNGKPYILYHDFSDSKPYKGYKGAWPIPGGGYIGIGDNAEIKFYTTLREQDNGEISEFKQMSINLPSYIHNFLHIKDTKGKHFFAKSLTKIVFSQPDQFAYIIRSVPINKEGNIFNNYIRKGAVNLKDTTQRIEPNYYDIYFTADSLGDFKPRVKKWTLSQIEPIPSTDDSLLFPSNKLDSLFELKSSQYLQLGWTKTITAKQPMSEVVSILETEIANDTISKEHLQMYLISLLIDANWSVDFTQSIIDDYLNEKHPNLNKDKAPYILSSNYGTPPTIKPVLLNNLRERKSTVEKFNDENRFFGKDEVEEVISYVEECCEKLEYLNTDGVAMAYQVDHERIMAKIRREDALAEQRRQERNARILSAVFGTMANVGKAVVNNTSKTSSSKSSYDGSVRGSSSSASDDSSSANDSKIDRKQHLKSQIIKYENEVKKAKASFEQAFENWSSNGSWESKRAMESKKETYELYLSKLESLKNELNAL